MLRELQWKCVWHRVSHLVSALKEVTFVKFQINYSSRCISIKFNHQNTSLRHAELTHRCSFFILWTISLNSSLGRSIRTHSVKYFALDCGRSRSAENPDLFEKRGGKTRSSPFCDGYAGYQCGGGGINQFSDGVRTAKALRGGRRGLERPRHSRAGKRKRNTSLTHVTSNSDFLLAPAPHGRLLLAV